MINYKAREVIIMQSLSRTQKKKKPDMFETPSTEVWLRVSFNYCVENSRMYNIQQYNECLRPHFTNAAGAAECHGLLQQLSTIVMNVDDINVGGCGGGGLC